MKFTCLFIIALQIVLLNAVGQNLVTNPSFENHINCPTGYIEVPLPSQTPTSVTGWTRPSAGSADYFNACATPPLYPSVPINVFGVQEARTGVAYCGLYAFGSTFITLNTYIDYREYLQTRLLSPMIAGHKYYVAYSVNLAGSRPTLLAVDRLGVLFRTTNIEDPTFGETLPYTPQLQTAAGWHLTDTTDWTTISDYYVASGNEEWMILGNFITNANIDTVYINYGPPPTPVHNLSYYYYDDVCVLDLDGDPLETTMKDTVLCSGGNLLLAGRPGAKDFLWNDGDTVSAKNIVTSGIYWVKSIDYNDCAFYIDTFLVTIGSKEIPINLGNDTGICDGQTIEVKAFHTDFTHYTWSNGSIGSSFEINSPGTYWVYAEGPCAYGSDTIVVSIIPPPTVSLPEDTILCNDGERLWLYQDLAYTHYSWNTGQDTCCIEATNSGLYILTVNNICGQEASDSIIVEYVQCNNCILMPNAFSPNGDGINDYLKAYSQCWFSSFSLSIYNRYGERVFHSLDINTGWDGRYKGILSDLGVYYYYIEALPDIANAKKIILKGDITLIY